MRLPRKSALVGWLLALCATAACVFLVVMLRDLRVKERLTAVQLVLPWSATVLPEDWSADRRRVLMVGDSRIRRWDSLPTRPGFVFAKSGVGGETVGQLERRFQRDVLDISPAPDAVIIAAGINDLVAVSIQSNYSPEFGADVVGQMLDRLKLLAQRAQENGLEPHIATIIQPAAPDLLRRLTFWDDSLYGLVRDANQEISKFAQQNDIGMIDFNAILDGAEGPLPEEFSADTLHFSPDGYRVLSAYLAEDNSLE